MTSNSDAVFVRKEEPLKKRKEALSSVIDVIKLLEHHEKIKDIRNRKQKNIRVLKVILNDCKTDLNRLQELLPSLAEIEPMKEVEEAQFMQMGMMRKGGPPPVSKLELEIQEIRDKIEKLNI